MILYRATQNKSDAKKIPAGSCWTPSREDAVAYLDRPNFARRSYIVSIEIADDASVLDLTSDDWGALADVLGRDPRETWTDGDLEYIEQAIDDRHIRSELAKNWAWVKYDDTFPDRCETWVRLC